MTSVQKKALWRWVISVVVVSRLWFFVPQYLPNLVPEALHNSGWVDTYVHIDSHSVHLDITHQFIDPLILGLITFLVGFIFCVSVDRFSRILTIFLAPAIFMLMAWVFLYHQNGNDLLFQFLDSITTLGRLFGWLVLGITSYSVLYFFILGVRTRFKGTTRN